MFIIILQSKSLYVPFFHLNLSPLTDIISLPPTHSSNLLSKASPFSPLLPHFIPPPSRQPPGSARLAPYYPFFRTCWPPISSLSAHNFHTTFPLLSLHFTFPPLFFTVCFLPDLYFLSQQLLPSSFHFLLPFSPFLLFISLHLCRRYYPHIMRFIG